MVINKILICLVFILTLSFQNLTKADDIRDFQIEGMSIGDSLLDYYPQKEIKKFIKTYYPKSKNFYVREIASNKFKTYDGVQFAFKKKDKDYKIYGINGYIFFETNFKKCLNKMNEIEKELDELFTDSVKDKQANRSHQADTSGKSKQWQIQYLLDNNGGVVSLECVDWSNKLTKNKGFTDNLNIAFYSKEYETFVRYEAY
jgi:hypothetical protein